VAGNVIPDRCVVTVNYRFAPDRDITAAGQHLREVFSDWPVEIVDAAPSARPGLGAGPAASFAAAVGGSPRAKLGWTDVARFAELGIPAVNYGPGISEIAHTRDEYVELASIADCEARMRRWLSTS
jgi:succinyl-diaminopimelate desuccinylase